MKFITYIRVLIILVLGIFSIGCMSEKSTQRDTLVIMNKQNCQLINIKKNQQFVIKLKSNPTTGYQWNVKDLPSFLKLVADDYQQDTQPKGMVGVGGESTLRFEGKEKGTGSLILSYERSWEKDQPAETLECQVKVD